jgi:hypothetical protein
LLTRRKKGPNPPEGVNPREELKADRVFLRWRSNKTPSPRKLEKRMESKRPCPPPVYVT